MFFKVKVYGSTGKGLTYLVSTDKEMDAMMKELKKKLEIENGKVSIEFNLSYMVDDLSITEIGNIDRIIRL